MHGIIYTRVSSDEQVEGMSLSFQQEDCIRYARDKHITIAQVFEEQGESAKFADRPELVKMLEYCRKHRRKIDVLIVWKLDRLSRNQMDYYFIKRTLLEYGISIHSATEPSLEDTSTIAGRVFETFSALQAEIDNTVRRERAVRGMEAKIASGIYPWKPPLGYVSARNRLKGLKKTEPDQPDETRFPIIERLFRACLDHGICSNVELAHLANEWGLRTAAGKRIYPQAIDHMMGNKFYAGLIYNPWKQEDVSGQHQAVISPDEFYRVQWLRKGHQATRPKERRSPEHPDFPLRRTVRCGLCGAPLTGSWSRGGGGRYAYYHCPKKACGLYGKAIRKADLEKSFLAKLAEITPKPKMLRTFEESVMEEWRRQQQERAQVMQKRKKRMKEVERRFDGLMIMKERNLLSDGEFLDRKEKLNSEIAGAKVELSDAAWSECEMGSAVAYARQFVTDLPRQWFDMAPEERRRFEKTVFPEGIPFHRGGGFGTAKLGLFYELIDRSRGSKLHLVRLISLHWNEILQELQLFRSLESYRDDCKRKAA